MRNPVGKNCNFAINDIINYIGLCVTASWRLRVLKVFNALRTTSENVVLITDYLLCKSRDAGDNFYLELLDEDCNTIVVFHAYVKFDGVGAFQRGIVCA